MPNKVYTQILVDNKADADKLLETYFDMSDATYVYENDCPTSEDVLALRELETSGRLNISKFMCAEDRDNTDTLQKAMNSRIVPSCVYAKQGFIGPDFTASENVGIQMTTIDGAPIPVILQIMNENPDMHIAATWETTDKHEIRSIEHDPSKDKYNAFLNQTLTLPTYDDDFNQLTESKLTYKTMSLAQSKDDLQTSFPVFCECYERAKCESRAKQAETLLESAVSGRSETDYQVDNPGLA